MEKYMLVWILFANSVGAACTTNETCGSGRCFIEDQVCFCDPNYVGSTCSKLRRSTQILEMDKAVPVPVLGISADDKFAMIQFQRSSTAIEDVTFYIRKNSGYCVDVSMYVNYYCLPQHDVKCTEPRLDQNGVIIRDSYRGLDTSIDIYNHLKVKLFFSNLNCCDESEPSFSTNNQIVEIMLLNDHSLPGADSCSLTLIASQKDDEEVICSLHGSYINGNCECNPTYVGHECQATPTMLTGILNMGQFFASHNGILEEGVHSYFQFIYPAGNYGPISFTFASDTNYPCSSSSTPRTTTYMHVQPVCGGDCDLTSRFDTDGLAPVVGATSKSGGDFQILFEQKDLDEIVTCGCSNNAGFANSVWTIMLYYKRLSTSPGPPNACRFTLTADVTSPTASPTSSPTTRPLECTTREKTITLDPVEPIPTIIQWPITSMNKGQQIPRHKTHSELMCKDKDATSTSSVELQGFDRMSHISMFFHQDDCKQPFVNLFKTEDSYNTNPDRTPIAGEQRLLVDSGWVFPFSFTGWFSTPDFNFDYLNDPDFNNGKTIWSLSPYPRYAIPEDCFYSVEWIVTPALVLSEATSFVEEIKFTDENNWPGSGIFGNWFFLTLVVPARYWKATLNITVTQMNNIDSPSLEVFYFKGERGEIPIHPLSKKVDPIRDHKLEISPAYNSIGYWSGKSFVTSKPERYIVNKLSINEIYGSTIIYVGVRNTKSEINLFNLTFDYISACIDIYGLDMCSPHGKCLDTGMCLCDSGYFGKLCEIARYEDEIFNAFGSSMALGYMDGRGLCQALEATDAVGWKKEQSVQDKCITNQGCMLCDMWNKDLSVRTSGTNSKVIFELTYVSANCYSSVWKDSSMDKNERNAPIFIFVRQGTPIANSSWDSVHSVGLGDEDTTTCSCYEDNINYDGYSIFNSSTESHSACQSQCQENSQCLFFSYHKESKFCQLKTSRAGIKSSSNYISGPEYCGTYTHTVDDVESGKLYITVSNFHPDGSIHGSYIPASQFIRYSIKIQDSLGTMLSLIIILIPCLCIPVCIKKKDEIKGRLEFLKSYDESKINAKLDNLAIKLDGQSSKTETAASPSSKAALPDSPTNEAESLLTSSPISLATSSSMASPKETASYPPPKETASYPPPKETASYPPPKEVGAPSATKAKEKEASPKKSAEEKEASPKKPTEQEMNEKASSHAEKIIEYLPVILPIIFSFLGDLIKTFFNLSVLWTSLNVIGPVADWADIQVSLDVSFFGFGIFAKFFKWVMELFNSPFESMSNWNCTSAILGISLYATVFLTFLLFRLIKRGDILWISMKILKLRTGKSLRVRVAITIASNVGYAACLWTLQSFLTTGPNMFREAFNNHASCSSLDFLMAWFLKSYITLVVVILGIASFILLGGEAPEEVKKKGWSVRFIFVIKNMFYMVFGYWSQAQVDSYKIKEIAKDCDDDPDDDENHQERVIEVMSTVRASVFMIFPSLVILTKISEVMNGSVVFGENDLELSTPYKSRRKTFVVNFLKLILTITGVYTAASSVMTLLFFAHIINPVLKIVEKFGLLEKFGL